VTCGAKDRLDDYAGDVKFDPRVIVSDMVATDPSVKNISCGRAALADVTRPASFGGPLGWPVAALEKLLRSGDRRVEVSLIPPRKWYHLEP
jgi:hypothetical protein